MSLKKSVYALALAMGLMLVSKGAHAVDLDWTSKTCVTIDHTFHVCKPSTSWDTQTKNIIDEPVRWVLHRSGPNPIIKLIYDQTARGKTAHDYAKIVRREIEQRAIKVTKVENRVINGRNVTIISGKGADDFGYLFAIYRDRTKGLKLECTAHLDNFSFFTQEFWASIQSVRFVGN